MDRRGWPEIDELVVCTVKRVTDFGAFVELDEYNRKEGLIHISEVASGWVKYIRDHVREGQKIVCKVLNVDQAKHHIDLSLKDVNEHQKREKIHEWKNEQKACKWIQHVAKSTNTDEVGLDKLLDIIYNKYGRIYTVFEISQSKGTPALVSAGIDKKQAEMILRVADENIKTPIVDIAGYVDLTCPAPDGIEKIKKALRSASKFDAEGIMVDISYIGAPKYRIHVIAPDYKKAENALKKVAMDAIQSIKDAGGLGEFHRHADTE